MFAITEPDAGSNTRRLSTTAVRDSDGWLLNGTKYYISGVDGAGAILVVARTGTDPGTGHGLLSLFLAPPDTPGLTVQPLPVAAALPERQFTLYFDDVRVGPDAAIQAHGGNGLAEESGWSRCGAWPGCSASPRSTGK